MISIIKGDMVTVVGSSDCPVCDHCGKTNLTRAVGIEVNSGDFYNVGVICASKLFRQSYRGKAHKVSPEAVLSMGKRAKREPHKITLIAV